MNVDVFPGYAHVAPMFTLYYARNTCSLASHIALEEAGAEYETVRVNFAESDQRKPEYLKLNPKGRVPAMVGPHGVITETPAILAFIAQSYPKSNLAPLDDAFAFAQVQSFNSYLCSTVHPAHAHRVRSNRWADDREAIESMKKKVPQNMGECFSLIEQHLFKGPWVMGEAYTICDPYLFTIAMWLESDSVDPARFPNILDHRNRMHQRAAVQKVLQRESD